MTTQFGSGSANYEFMRDRYEPWLQPNLLSAMW